MNVIMMGILKSLMTEWLMKRIAYTALKALAKSTKNDLDDKMVLLIGQSLGLEDK